MPTKQGTDFVSLLYAKQILMQRYKINVDTQFLGKAEGRFQDGRSRIRYFAISTGAPSSVGASLQGISRRILCYEYFVAGLTEASRSRLRECV